MRGEGLKGQEVTPFPWSKKANTVLTTGENGFIYKEIAGIS